MRQVTDPELLQQLNGSSEKEVTDPAILAQLNGTAAQPEATGSRNPFPAGYSPSPLEEVLLTGLAMKRGAVDHALFGLPNEVAAGAQGVGSFLTGQGYGAGYDKAIQDQDIQRQMVQQYAPARGALYNVGASLLSPDPLEKLTMPGKLGNIAVAGIKGTLASGAQAAGEAQPGQRLQAAEEAAPWGAAFGVGGQALSEAGGAAINWLKGQTKQAVVNAARSEGLRVPPSAITDNRLVQFLESRAAQSGLSGKSYDVLMRDLDDDFITQYTDVLDNISKSEFLNSGEAGEITQASLKGREKASQRAVGRQYEDVVQKFGDEPVIPTNSSAYIDRAIKKLSNTAAASSSKEDVLAKLGEIKNSLVIPPEAAPERATNLFTMTDAVPPPQSSTLPTIEKMINTKTDLNTMINYGDYDAGVKRYLRGMVGNISKDLGVVAKSNPDFGNEFMRAESGAKMNAQTFRNKLVKNMLRGERPEAILGQLNAPSDVAKLENALGSSPKAQKIVGQIKRMRLEELLDNKFIKGNLEKSPEYGSFSSKLADNQKQNQLIRSLTGSEQYKRLENLRTVAEGVARGKRFFNFSKSGNVAQDVGLITTGILSAFGAGNPLPLAIAGTPYAISKIITSEGLLDLLTEAARVNNGGDHTISQAAARMLASALTDDKPKKEQQNVQ